MLISCPAASFYDEIKLIKLLFMAKIIRYKEFGKFMIIKKDFNIGIPNMLDIIIISLYRDTANVTQCARV